jgi:hypothetical protein
MRILALRDDYNGNEKVTGQICNGCLPAFACQIVILGITSSNSNFDPLTGPADR